MVYCDESVEEGSSVNIHQPTTFAHKNLTLDGAAVFWDEFSESARAGLKSPPPQTVSLSNLSRKILIFLLIQDTMYYIVSNHYYAAFSI